MKNTMKFGVFVLIAGLLFGCTSALHNGTQMTLSQVKITGLPADPYASGMYLVFDLYNNGVWVHATDALHTTTSIYAAQVQGDGSITFHFSPALVITDPVVKFLIIDASNTTPEWDTYKIGKDKIKGKNGEGADGQVDNPWSAGTILGTVTGDDVAWTVQ